MGFFVIKEDNEISFSDVLYWGNINLIVRYENPPESLEWTTLYNYIEEFNGERIESQTGIILDELSSKYCLKWNCNWRSID